MAAGHHHRQSTPNDPDRINALTVADLDNLNLVTPAPAAVVAALPTFAMLIAFQRQLMRGLTAGAVKG